MFNEIKKNLQGIFDYYMIDKPLFKISHFAQVDMHNHRSNEWNAKDVERAQCWEDYFTAKDDFMKSTTSSLHPKIAASLIATEKAKTSFFDIYTSYDAHISPGYYAYRHKKQSVIA